MLRVFVRLSIGLIIALCLIVGAIRLVGATIPQPMSETLEQFDCTPKPCWHGIHIGVTTVQEAAQILSADQNISLFEYHSTDPYVCWRWNNRPQYPGSDDGCYTPEDAWPLEFAPVDSTLRLGDMLPLMGKPITSYLCNIEVGYIYSKSMTVWITVPYGQLRIDPEMTVLQIGYFPVKAVTDSVTERPWLGLSEWANLDPDCPG